MSRKERETYPTFMVIYECRRVVVGGGGMVHGLRSFLSCGDEDAPAIKFAGTLPHPLSRQNIAGIPFSHQNSPAKIATRLDVTSTWQLFGWGNQQLCPPRASCRIQHNPTISDHDEDRTPPPYDGNKNIVVAVPPLIGSNDIIFFFFVVVVQLFLRRCRL